MTAPWIGCAPSRTPCSRTNLVLIVGGLDASAGAIADDGMPEMSLCASARSDQPVRINFEMRGSWQGVVVVTRPGPAPVAVPLDVDVQSC